MLDMEPGEPDKQQAPKPSGHAALISEIDDVQGAARLQQVDGPLKRVVPWRDHGKRIGEDDVVEAIHLVESRSRIEPFRISEPEADFRFHSRRGAGRSPPSPASPPRRRCRNSGSPDSAVPFSPDYAPCRSRSRRRSDPAEVPAPGSGGHGRANSISGSDRRNAAGPGRSGPSSPRYPRRRPARTCQSLRM